LFSNPDEISNRPATLILLSELITAVHDSTVKDSHTSSESVISLMPFKDEVLGVVTAGLKLPASCRPALRSLKVMVTMKVLLTEEELGFIVHNINEILNADPDDIDDVR
jgi:DNA repair/transcription protein MET18/MMS19